MNRNVKIPVKNEDLALFKHFYQNLDSQKNVFFMFFTSNLLHYALESISLVPQEENLVILTSGILQEETNCIRKYIKRPHLNFETVYHDTCIWEMIHRTTKFNFGWLDVDCFIYNPLLFKEIVKIDSCTGIQTVWSRKYDYYGINCLFANTYFQFVNADILNKLSNKYENITFLPRVFTSLDTEPIYGNYSYLNENEMEFLIKNYPHIVDNDRGYDTSHHYQIILTHEGYKVKQIRTLNQLDTYYSEEALHLGGCYRIHTAILEKNLRKVYFRFNMRYSYYLLYKYLEILPVQYQLFQNDFSKNMQRNNLTINISEVKEAIYSYAERNHINMSRVEVNEYDRNDRV